MTYITENKHKQPLNKRKQTINVSSSALLPRLLCLTTVIIPQLRQHIQIRIVNTNVRQAQVKNKNRKIQAIHTLAVEKPANP